MENREVIPFKFSNELATFQGIINKTLAENLAVSCVAYPEGIPIHTGEAGSAQAV